MTLQDRPAFDKALLGLATVFNMSVNAARFEHYWAALHDLSYSAFEAACVHTRKHAGTTTCRFFPLPGVLREHAAAQQRSSKPVECPTCKGLGWLTADPDMSLAKKLYGQQAPATVSQATVRRCECRTSKA